MSITTVSLGKTSLEVSRLGLGTVEIGLPYGIGVDTLPTDQEAERILKTAVELGITYVDTARGYGVAEERIGKSGVGKLPNVVIGTKCAQFLEKGEDPRGEELAKRIREEVETSLRNLQTDSLQLVQLHGGTAEQIERGELIEVMQQLVDQGKIQHVGIATRGEEAPLAAIQSGFFATIQTAYSILDQRMAQLRSSTSSERPEEFEGRQGSAGQAPSVFGQAQTAGVGILNRSVLLKGALTAAAQKLPEKLAPLKENSAKAAAIAKAAGVDLPTLALRFVISHPAVSTALLGTITPAHLETAIAAINAGPLPTDILEQLYPLAINDPEQVDPAKWPKI